VWESAYIYPVTALISARTNLISTAYMSGKRTLEESDEDVYHVGSWNYIFLPAYTWG
jgi:hypothetical protein